MQLIYSIYHETVLFFNKTKLLWNMICYEKAKMQYFTLGCNACIIYALIDKPWKIVSNKKTTRIIIF